MQVKYNSSWLNVCNTALARVNAEPIMTFDDDSVRASLCKAMLLDSIAEILNVMPWKSARAISRLMPQSLPPAWGHQYKYELPVNLVKIVSIKADNDQWEIVGSELHADVMPLDIMYTAVPDDAQGLDPLILSAITARLASKLCMSLTADPSMTQLLLQDSITVLTLAKKQESAYTGYKDIELETNSWKEAFSG